MSRILIFEVVNWAGRDHCDSQDDGPARIRYQEHGLIGCSNTENTATDSNLAHPKELEDPPRHRMTG